MTTMTSGQLAKEAGVNVETLRFYERKGLLEEPIRLESGHRRYSPDVIARIQFIKNAQDLGFSLREIQELLDLRVTPGSTAADVRGRVLTKITDVDRRIKRLHAIKKSLTLLVATCSDRSSASDCPILDNLDKQEIKS